MVTPLKEIGTWLVLYLANEPTLGSLLRNNCLLNGNINQNASAILNLISNQSSLV